MVEKLNKVGRAERKLVTELGREPTPEEVAEVTGIDPEEVDSIKRSAQAPLQQLGSSDQSCVAITPTKAATTPIKAATTAPQPAAACAGGLRSGSSAP